MAARDLMSSILQLRAAESNGQGSGGGRGSATLPPSNPLLAFCLVAAVRGRRQQPTPQEGDAGTRRSARCSNRMVVQQWLYALYRKWSTAKR